MVVLDRVCGTAQQTLFIGFSDLFQKILDGFIPDWWPMNYVQYYFDLIFNTLQDQMKPVAYAQGAEMGRQMEAQINAWIKSKFDSAISQITAARNEALAQIQQADALLTQHTAKIQNLLERVAALEGQTSKYDLLNKKVL